MLNTQLLGEILKRKGFDFYSGVPCSFLKFLINYAINECDYIMSANEGDAVATCAGASLSGRKSIVLFQNSGLTNATSPLASLLPIFKIPILGFVSLRGEVGINDEPQHELMGRITTSILNNLEIKWEYLSDNPNETEEQINRADIQITNNKTFFFVVKKGILGKVILKEPKLNIRKNILKIEKNNKDEFPKRAEVLHSILSATDAETAFLATTGYTGRELYEINDQPNNLYMVGSMGCISSLGLGLALSKNKKKIIVIDGDGALLMRMGALSTNSYYAPKNLLHILLDNNCHESTGGQATVSHNIDFVSCTAAMGYPKVIYTSNVIELKKHIQNWKKDPTLTFLYLKIAKGSNDNLSRPTIKPFEVKERFMNFINN